MFPSGPDGPVGGFSARSGKFSEKSPGAGAPGEKSLLICRGFRLGLGDGLGVENGLGRRVLGLLAGRGGTFRLAWEPLRRPAVGDGRLGLLLDVRQFPTFGNDQQLDGRNDSAE